MWRSRRLRRIAVGLWLVAMLVVWNVRFDRAIRGGVDRYLAQHAAWTRGDALRPSLEGVMAPAAAEGARVATAWTAPLLLAGGVALARRRLRPAAG
jgi:hypothetical protein